LVGRTKAAILADEALRKGERASRGTTPTPVGRHWGKIKPTVAEEWKVDYARRDAEMTAEPQTVVAKTKFLCLEKCCCWSLRPSVRPTSSLSMCSSQH
jgi:hypothetical protein